MRGARFKLPFFSYSVCPFFVHNGRTLEAISIVMGGNEWPMNGVDGRVLLNKVYRKNAEAESELTLFNIHLLG